MFSRIFKGFNFNRTRRINKPIESEKKPIKRMVKSNYLWLLDPGHGGIQDGIYTTCPNYDPNNKYTWHKMHIHNDGTKIFEGEFNRAIVDRIAKMCKDNGIEYQKIVESPDDMRLSDRTDKANQIYLNDRKAVYVSVHSNSMDHEHHGLGRGYEVYTSVGETRSDKFATYFFDKFKQEFPEIRMRADYIDGDPDKESQFWVLRKTKCPALLTENFFFDNYKECTKYLLTKEGRDRIAKAHFDAILAIEAANNI